MVLGVVCDVDVWVGVKVLVTVLVIVSVFVIVLVTLETTVDVTVLFSVMVAVVVTVSGLHDVTDTKSKNRTRIDVKVNPNLFVVFILFTPLT